MESRPASGSGDDGQLEGANGPDRFEIGVVLCNDGSAYRASRQGDQDVVGERIGATDVVAHFHLKVSQDLSGLFVDGDTGKEGPPCPSKGRKEHSQKLTVGW